ncbi:hypothetical protein C8R43DRAFT_116152 [Mycena crocata]|nr:hypothetical protein C8R43DRAFT_116152 [Mycena crocata]
MTLDRPLSMSHLIACDAPLLSPTDYPQYSPTQDPYSSQYYCASSLPPSPPTSIDDDSPAPAARMLKLPVNDSLHCVPTHQLFDFPQVSPSPSESPSPGHHPRLSISINPVACKRSASPELGHTKKRAAGERISSKDFIPPDVSGLSKREARLVKNRAAAFLSRQRKREEFELMEVRVAELEQENARLLAIAKGGSSGNGGAQRRKSDSNDALVSEIEQLRAQLQAAEERERELNAELTAKAASHDVSPVKLEPSEPSFPLSPAPRMQSPHKSAASLGLMVLLCALPSLLSMPSNSALPTSFSVPHPLPASASSFDFNSYLPSDYDWSHTGGSVMDLDVDDKRRVIDTTATMRKLEFTDTDAGALAGLGGLDISFDASPLDDRKIRVRIHPSSSASSRAPSPGSNYATTKQENPFATWFGPDSDSSASLSSESYVGVGYPSSSGADPFLGVGGYGLPYSSSSSSPFMYSQDDLSSVDYSDSDFGVASEYSVADSTTGGKRRVRIALKSLPASGGEGGEWEVQFC